MAFRYHNTTAFLAIACNETKEWAYIGFSSEPNILGSDMHDGHDTFRMRIKWDDGDVMVMAMGQRWGACFIHFRRSVEIIENAIWSGSLLIELNWYSVGRTHFRIPLAGSARAIARRVQFVLVSSLLPNDESSLLSIFDSAIHVWLCRLVEPEWIAPLVMSQPDRFLFSYHERHPVAAAGTTMSFFLSLS